jgi:hypothetical protein
MQPGFEHLLNLFNQSLHDCKQLYARSARRIVDEHPQLLAKPAPQFVEEMNNLCGGLLVKLFVAIGEVDHVWTREELAMVGVLIFQLWQVRVTDQVAMDAIHRLASQAKSLSWAAVIDPFLRYPPLSSEIPELETVVVRAGNLVAKADGRPSSLELEMLKNIQNQLFLAIHRADSSPTPVSASPAPSPSNVAQQEINIAAAIATNHGAKETEAQSERPSLADALDELNKLVGLSVVKSEVNTLVIIIIIIYIQPA